ncbi:hypothetical protein T492DRAFT_1085914 [Pavlovales sp. CCMP2436]|nr:hypothetical protein T492DRAFT_1085914 [Pavlovales sp. CCMP2436]
MASDAIKSELADRARRVVVTAGAVARGEPRPGSSDDLLVAARAFAQVERHMLGTDAALTEIGALLGEAKDDFVAISFALSRISNARAGLLAALDSTRCGSGSASLQGRRTPVSQGRRTPDGGASASVEAAPSAAHYTGLAEQATPLLSGSTDHVAAPSSDSAPA